MAARNPTNNGKDDFNPNELIKKNLEDQGKDITVLTEKVKELEKRFGTNENIADTLCETSEKAVKMKTMLADNFIKLLNEDERVKKKIAEVVNAADRDYRTALLKRFGFMAWTAFVSIISIIVGILLHKYIH